MLKKCLGAMDGMNAVLDAKGSLPEDPPGRTEVVTQPPVILGPPEREAWPVIPQYEILEELGRGGMGVVFKARQIALGRIVALKTILPHGADPGRTASGGSCRRPRPWRSCSTPISCRSTRSASRASIRFSSWSTWRGKAFPRSLAGKPLPPRKAAEMVAVLARAVQAAHEHGIIHRDLKPTNILLAADGTPKICDFGLAKHFEKPADHTQTGQILGTPSYMAPEQVRGACGEQARRSTSTPWGRCSTRCLTGRPPFLADNPLDTLQLVIKPGAGSAAAMAAQDAARPGDHLPEVPGQGAPAAATPARGRWPRIWSDSWRASRSVPGRSGPVERGWRWCRGTSQRGRA